MNSLNGKEGAFTVAEPAKPDGELCLAIRKAWPHKTCNLQVGHIGQHCNEHYCGTKLVRLYWGRNE